ncbi:hypothetical protein [Schumannella soli]|uniref:Uncharacterized protein n=1 Tax=Schumannella soli TaxID=2590779 RepID=A0A506Y3F4_9MICO|nr:hypothetical protein [Schumannella soli]TPW75957.1 hypothetical protein FJ657_08960 [Schumannella soli]
MDESELRSRLQDGDDDPTSRIDVTAVLRRARRRRAPRLALVGGAAGLLVIGLAVPAVGAVVFAGGSAGSSSAGSADSAASGAPEDQGLTPERGSGSPRPLDHGDDGTTASGGVELLRCGAATPPASGTGLRLELGLDRAADADGSRTGVATLTNTGSVAVRGTTPAVAAAGLARDGRFVAVHTGPDIQSVIEVDLQPGQSVEVPVSIETVDCAGAELAEGDYRALAAVRIVLDDGSVRAVVAAPVDLRLG